MGAVQAVGTAGTQALGTEESMACSRNQGSKSQRECGWQRGLSNKAGAHLKGHMQCAQGFLL